MTGEGTNGAERRDLLDALFIVCDFVARGALLAEPEYPAALRHGTAGVQRVYGSEAQECQYPNTGAHCSIRTYVFRRGCTERVPLEELFPLALSFPCAFSSPDAVETKVEKCLEDGTRGRAAPGGLADAGLWVVAVVVVKLPLLELARKRDWEWFEK